ncbi:MAG: ABC transporter ATP-binding protein [Thermoleophilia bacterium]
MTLIVEARGLRKRYRLGKDNYVDALRGADMEIVSGEMVAIVGPSGSGKSTLMHIIGCLDSADAGTVNLNGRSVERLNEAALTRVRREELGFIFQGYNLIPTLTALDNVALAAEYAGRSRKEAVALAREGLALVGLSDRERHQPNELSGGQQQRVAVARALVNRPALVLGDEPTGNLDSATSADTMAMMRRINQETGTTFVLVTHDTEVAEVCDRIILMRDGVVVGEEIPQGAVEGAALGITRPSRVAGAPAA